MNGVARQSRLLPRHARPPGWLVGDVESRLRRLRPDAPSRYALGRLTPSQAIDDDWLPAARALPEIVRRAGEKLPHSPAVHASSIAGALAYAVLGRPGVALAVVGRVPDPAGVWVRLGPDGLVQEAAVAGRSVAVLASDPLAGHPDAVVIDGAPTLADWLAGRAFAILGPLLAALQDHTRFGLVPMWNLAADNVLGPGTVAALLAGQDQASGRAAANAVVDRLVALGAPVRRRGTTQPVLLSRWIGRAVQAPVRGSCCLHYRDAEPPGRPTESHRADPSSPALCASCPLLDPALRRPRFEQSLPPAGGPGPVPTPRHIVRPAASG